MSPLLRDELRVGLCPKRLVLARFGRALKPRLIESSIVTVDGDPVAQLQALVADPSHHGTRLTVILSSHFVRYVALPWNDTLRTREEWIAYAKQMFGNTYGAAAADWQICLCGTGRRKPRLACAIDAHLLRQLRELPGIASIQPYLMTSFNARRRVFDNASAWFVLQEPGRLTLSLIVKGEWKLVRCRQAQDDWQETLPDLLDRESPVGEEACERALTWSEQEMRAGMGRYQARDITLYSDTKPELRPLAMALA